MQPYINQIRNFDAKNLYTVEYKYLGAERVLTNELSVRENVKNSSPVYVRQSTKFDKEHVIPKDSLTNGKSYLAKIRVKLFEGATEQLDIWSDWSAENDFICLATPVFDFVSLDEKNYIYNDDIMMQVIYRQQQGEKIKNYQFSLLDQNKTPIKIFPTRMPSKISPNVLEERFSNLVKGRLYYIKCQIDTLNGINYFDTHEFIPHFASPSLDGIIETQNQYENGQILVQSFLKQTLGIQTRPYIPGKKSSSSDNYTYIGGEWVVIPPDKPLQYTSLGMAKASDWIAKVWCKNVIKGLFLELDRKDGNGIGLKFYKYDNYIICEKTYLGVTSRTISNIVYNLGLSEFYLYVKVIEFRVKMTIVKKGDVGNTAYAYSADGMEGFTTVYPNLNLLSLSSVQIGKYLNWSNGLDLFGNANRAVFDYIQVTPNQTYTLSSYWNGWYISVFGYSDKTSSAKYILTGVKMQPITGSGFSESKNVTFTVPADCNYLRVHIGHDSINTSASVVKSVKVKIETDSTATPYMPSSSEVTTSDYPSYVGTYYDGQSTHSQNPYKYSWGILGDKL